MHHSLWLVWSLWVPEVETKVALKRSTGTGVQVLLEPWCVVTEDQLQNERTACELFHELL